jgi:hypothetical protein
MFRRAIVYWARAAAQVSPKPAPLKGQSFEISRKRQPFEIRQFFPWAGAAAQAIPGPAPLKGQSFEISIKETAVRNMTVFPLGQSRWSGQFRAPAPLKGQSL